MGGKGGVKEKFSFGGICGEKSEKAHLSAYGGYAAELPACFLTLETLSLVPSRIADARKRLLHSLFPAMPTGRLEN